MALAVQAPPEGWAQPPLRSSAERLGAGNSGTSPVRVIESFEGLVESREGDLVYARLIKDDTQLYREFSLSTFSLGGPVEAGSTFEARRIVDGLGVQRWENVPHPPVEVPAELIQEWRSEGDEFAGSGL